MMIFRQDLVDSPLVVSIPHAGRTLAEGLSSRLNEQGRTLFDTDWHVDRLIDGVASQGFSCLIALCSRVVVDLNRSPDDRPLYAGAGTTLVPLESFSGQPLYRDGQEPTEQERRSRVRTFWWPYHEALEAMLMRARRRYGHAVLLDLHSIASSVPRLFDGVLPDLNLGTHSGRSCAPGLEARVSLLLDAQDGFSTVVNGRFKGGFITRHYGRPDQSLHAMQLEIAQHSYMDEGNPQRWDSERAEPMIRFIDELIEVLLRWVPRES
jgi:N-formylglutamate deformylase